MGLFRKNRPGRQKAAKVTDARVRPLKAVLAKLIATAQRWSHSKIGWAGNKIALLLGPLLSKSGVDGGDTAAVIAGAVVTVGGALLEFGVRVASARLLGVVQGGSGGELEHDNWPGGETVGYVERNLVRPRHRNG